MEYGNHTRNALRKRSNETSNEDQDIKMITGTANPVVVPLGAIVS